MKLTKRQLRRIIREEKSKLLREAKAIAGYYDGIPDQRLDDELIITAIAMRLDTKMPEQAAVNLAMLIVDDLRAQGLLN